MLSRIADPISSNRSNLFIVCSEGLEFKSCDKCKLTIQDRICLCNTCKKCLHLKCAGVEKKNTRSKIPASKELPESCRDCLTSTRSTVGSNSNGNRFIKSTIHHPKHELEDKDADCLVRKCIPGHELEQKHYGTFYECSGCQSNSFGPHFACKDSRCLFKLHKDCVSPRKFMMHPFFPESSFDFSSSPKLENSEHHKVNCSACRMDVNGYFYQSKIRYEKCWYKIYLHPSCANLPRQIICQESGATMFLKPNTTSKCKYCDASHLMVGDKMTNRKWSWSYVSGFGDIHLHVRCIMRMLSDVTESRVKGSTSMLTIVPETEKQNYSITKYKFKIATAADAKTVWERKFREIMKYAKIALGAIIAAILGDPTTFIFKCTVTINS